MRHSPGDFEAYLFRRPVGMPGGHAAAKRIAGKPPKTKRNRETLRGCLRAQHLSHLPIHHFHRWAAIGKVEIVKRGLNR